MSHTVCSDPIEFKQIVFPGGPNLSISSPHPISWGAPTVTSEGLGHLRLVTHGVHYVRLLIILHLHLSHLADALIQSNLQEQLGLSALLREHR